MYGRPSGTKEEVLDGLSGSFVKQTIASVQFQAATVGTATLTFEKSFSSRNAGGEELTAEDLP